MWNNDRQGVAAAGRHALRQRAAKREAPTRDPPTDTAGTRDGNWRSISLKRHTANSSDSHHSESPSSSCCWLFCSNVRLDDIDNGRVCR